MGIVGGLAVRTRVLQHNRQQYSGIKCGSLIWWQKLIAMPDWQRKDYLYNVLFYLNQHKPDMGLKIVELLQRKSEEYDWLQHRHNFIQWLFPNHYRSAFNYQSHSLTPEEAFIFRTNPIIAGRLFSAFQLFLGFMGSRYRLEDNTIRVQNSHRFRAVIESGHNHLRFLRILACLSVTGFRKQAESFGKFLLSQPQKHKLRISKTQLVMKYLEVETMQSMCKASRQTIMTKSVMFDAGQKEDKDKIQ